MLICALVLVALSGAVAGAATSSTHVTITTRGFPGDSAIGFGSLWVVDHIDGVLYRVNPRTNRFKTIEVGESLCSMPVFGAGAVWVWGCDSNVTYKVDPRANRVVGKRLGVGPAFAAGSLWTMSATMDKLLRIDPKSGVTLASIPMDMTNGGPQLGADGSMWVSADDAVTRVDLQTNKVTAVIPLAGWKPSGNVPGGYLYANFIAFANGKIWDSNRAGMYVIDPATNTAERIKLTFHPMSLGGDVQVASGAGSVWARTSDTSIARIDAATGSVIGSYPADRAGGGGGTAVGFGSLWVTNVGKGTIWREPIR
jgi:sugar lactone lactonase YvrE